MELKKDNKPVLVNTYDLLMGHRKGVDEMIHALMDMGKLDNGVFGAGLALYTEQIVRWVRASDFPQGYETTPLEELPEPDPTPAERTETPEPSQG